MWGLVITAQPYIRHTCKYMASAIKDIMKSKPAYEITHDLLIEALAEVGHDK
jgi:hypothetical protein